MGARHPLVILNTVTERKVDGGVRRRLPRLGRGWKIAVRSS
jgi:hypothetical protein